MVSRTSTPPIGAAPLVIPLAKVSMSGNTPALGGEGKTKPAVTGDDFVENQENAVLLGDLAQRLR